MAEKLMVFDYNFNNEELQNEFNDFFYSNGLLSIFTYEHMASSIRVSYLDALSVVNNGSYGKVLQDFAEILQFAEGNQMFEDSLFKLLYRSTSFQRMINIIKRIISNFSETSEKYKKNFWNIVFYSKSIF